MCSVFVFASQLFVVAHFLSPGNSRTDCGSGVQRGTAACALGVKVMIPLCGFLDVVVCIQDEEMAQRPALVALQRPSDVYVKKCILWFPLMSSHPSHTNEFTVHVATVCKKKGQLCYLKLRQRHS
uniref:Putative secreted protein n=1 Tax=Amblyomma parvum TaxID=251391 RepID=A0A023FZ81_AMBPA